MIDEKILLQQLQTEYDKILACYHESDECPFYAAELSALDEVIKIVRKQKKIRIDLDALPVERGLKNSFPKKLLDEWDSAMKNFRRCKGE